MIELGIGMFGDLQINPITGAIQPAAARLQEIIREVKLMDDLGVDFFGIGEHHRPDYAVASPEILLAAAASVTQRIKLGSAVSVISSADPVKLYQDFATVDLISDGRAEIMAGRGSFVESFPKFGYHMKDYNALFEEKLDLLLKLNTQERVNWTGQFRPTLVDQAIYPKAKNNSMPIWIAVGGTPESVLRAGRLGLPVMFAIIGGSYEHFKPLFELYKETYLESGHPEDKFQVGVHMHSFFGDSDKVVDDYYPLYAAQMDRIGATRGWPKYQRMQYDYGRSDHGHLVVGDAAYSIDKILEVIETFKLTRFSAHLDVGAPDHKSMMKAIEIYGEKIVPEVKKALKA